MNLMLDEAIEEKSSHGDMMWMFCYQFSTNEILNRWIMAENYWLVCGIHRRLDNRIGRESHIRSIAYGQAQRGGDLDLGMPLHFCRIGWQCMSERKTVFDVSRRVDCGRSE